MICINHKKYHMLESINSISPSFVKISYHAYFNIFCILVMMYGDQNTAFWLGTMV
jgi:hypothetical protein